ncbi:hypothetical protein [Spiroplasma eriocheiris]|uniref:Uncharacterized protein n=1 Tax=Spiroplasma eriocheiris TaxID=315358 RepID=A0A0H3XMI1_9MOLU|nr:hypothetical protein [Spiroplasma eriocheiris]AHF57695.1 hypothetical protein SPE_0567 [Spiroplasma eriocheiris CCTCC M 207170]AKM54147.1 hypothetical protein SERIO_v1c05760 [Spiroplasma eriocheiris]
MLLKDLMKINRGVVINRFEHFAVKCPNCDGKTPPTSYQIWPNHQRDFCRKIDPNLLITQPGDLLIYAKYPFTSLIIKKESEINKLVPSNYYLLRKLNPNKKISISNLQNILKEKFINPYVNTANDNEELKKLTIKILDLSELNITDPDYLSLITGLHFSQKVRNIFWWFFSTIIILFIILGLSPLINSLNNKPLLYTNLGISIFLGCFDGVLLIILITFLGIENHWGAKTKLKLKTVKDQPHERKIKKLIYYKELYEQNLITLDEYNLVKQKILKLKKK